MYINSGYHNHSLIDFKDKSRPLIVGSCGTYRLSSHPKLPTYRPRGRLDFQIIYIAAGRAHFHFDNADDDTVVTAGKYFTAPRNSRNMNTMALIKQKFTGYILPEVM